MPLRRRAIAPQDMNSVLMERISALEQQVKALRQSGASHIQAEDMGDTFDAFPWQTMINWPGRHRPARPHDNYVYYHPGRVDQLTEEEVPEGWKVVTPSAIFAIKVFSDRTSNRILDGAFRFDIPEDLDGAYLLSVAGFNGVVGTGPTTAMIQNVTKGVNMLTVPITIDASESNSYTAATQPQVSQLGAGADPNRMVHTGDTIWINMTAAGAGSKGFGLYMELN